jgi:hypothetical protein
MRIGFCAIARKNDRSYRLATTISQATQLPVVATGPEEDRDMAIEVIYADRPSQVVSAKVEGDNLWLGAADLARISGWQLKPEGVCKDDVCVPIPVAREADFVRDHRQSFNLASFARLMGQPILHDDKNAVWYFGENAGARLAALKSLEAPDFELPDLDGKMHRLSEYRGKKVLLSAWASW